MWATNIFVTFNNPKRKWEKLLCFLCQLKTIHIPNHLTSLDFKVKDVMKMIVFYLCREGGEGISKKKVKNT